MNRNIPRRSGIPREIKDRGKNTVREKIEDYENERYKKGRHDKRNLT